MKAKILAEIEELEIELLRSIGAFFSERELPFDTMAFLDQTSIDLSDLAREAMFYGAERFPLEPAATVVSILIRQPQRSRVRSEGDVSNKKASARKSKSLSQPERVRAAARSTSRKTAG